MNYLSAPFIKEISLKYGNIFTITIIIRKGFIPLGCVRGFIFYLETTKIWLLTNSWHIYFLIQVVWIFYHVSFSCRRPQYVTWKLNHDAFILQRTSAITFDEDKKQWNKKHGICVINKVVNFVHYVWGFF